MMKSFLLSFLILFPIFAQAQTSDSWKKYSYRVIKITDGDTLTATDGNLKFKVRLAGLDSPESRQTYGKVATFALKEKLLEKNIQIKSVGSGIDPYGRVLGQVYFEGKDVAVELIERGLATYYRPQCVEYPANKNLYDYDPRTYVDAEAKARAKNLNIWANPDFKLPCEFRKSNKK